MGRTFQESFQKALRGLEVGVDGLNEKTQDREVLEKELGEPGPERIWYVGDAFAHGPDAWTKCYELTKIDPWFLVQIEEIVKIELELENDSAWTRSTRPRCSCSSKKGFSDRRLARQLKTTDKAIREKRRALGMRPVYKRVDTCAAEFATNTAYMYSTYEDECEAEPTDNKKIMVLGGGPNRIGQGIEFDYCCVHAALAMREDGYETIMVNCNPGDRVDRLRHLRPPVLRAADAGRRAGDRRQGKAARRDRAVRRPDAAEAGAGPGSRTACPSSAPRPT